MDVQFYANLLGVNPDREPYAKHHENVTTQASWPSSFSGVSYAGLSEEALNRGTAPGIVARMGMQMAQLLQQISNLTDVEKRRVLALEFREEVIAALKEAGYQAQAGSSPDKIVVEGKLYDILRSMNSAGATVAAQFLLIEDNYDPAGGANGSVSDIVYSVGRANADLINKINSAETLEERRRWCADFIDKVIAALQTAGFSAEDIGKPDKIVVNGTLYDILRAANGLGMNTAVQLLNLGPYGNSPQNDPRFAILSIAAEGAGLLSQISDSTDLTERRSLAEQLRELALSALQSAGFTAVAGDSPDQLVINGVTYDFIRNLNYPGISAQLQALQIV